MNSKTRALMGMFMFAALSEGVTPNMFEESNGEIQRKRVKKEPPNPRGTKTYFFNQWGVFHNGRMKKDECVFICVAINNKNALRKFKKWESQQGSK